MAEKARNALAEKVRKPVAVYIRLVSDEAIPEDRRVFYGLMGIGGCRLGEAEAIRIRNVDLARMPLGSLLIARSHERDWTKG